MTIRIPLPDMGRVPKGIHHPYPLRIGLQTLEFMQGSLFYASLVDIASGAYIRQPDGMNNLERIFLEKLDSPKTYEEAWGILGKYQVVFEKVSFQSVLIAMNSHWDWYARKLMDFILFVRLDLNLPMLNKSDVKRIERFSSLPIVEQLEVIQVAADIKLNLSEEEKSELHEMALVRNLGLHNRWEIDRRYLERTLNRGMGQVGDLRIIEREELNKWYLAFLSVVQRTNVEVAKVFVKANDFPQ